MSQAYNQRWIVLLEGHVYLSVGSGHISAENMRVFDEEMMNIIDASQVPLVHLISDSRQVLSMPSLAEIMKNRHPQHPRMGYSITIGAFHNPVMRFLLTLSATISNVRYKDVATLAEACAYLAHKDPSLPPLAAWNIPSESDLEAS